MAGIMLSHFTPTSDQVKLISKKSKGKYKFGSLHCLAVHLYISDIVPIKAQDPIFPNVQRN